MTAPTDTFTTVAQIGQREDLLDAINDVSPTECPVLDGFPSQAASGRLHEWQRDVLKAPKANAQPEGSDAQQTAVVPTERLANPCQISAEWFIVSNTTDAVDTAGRRTESGYQVIKHGAELKRDIETHLTGNDASSVGDPRVQAGMESWMATNTVRGSGGTDGGFNPGTGLVAAPGDGTPFAFDEANFKDAIQQIFISGGNARTILMPPKQKQVFSTFPGRATNFRDVGSMQQAQIIAGADIYVSDFGEHMVYPERFMRDRTVLLLDPDYWAVSWLRRMQSKRLADTGDNKRYQIVCEWTLCAKEERSSGVVADLS